MGRAHKEQLHKAIGLPSCTPEKSSKQTNSKQYDQSGPKGNSTPNYQKSKAFVNGKVQ